jgi:hypothetical protein
MEFFMAGGNYAASEVPFPKGFPDRINYLDCAEDRSNESDSGFSVLFARTNA